MRRSRVSRAVASVAALLLAFAAQQEAVGFAHCPHHGIAAAAAPAGMAGMSHMPTAPGHQHHKACTCIGSCCTSPAVAQASLSGGLTWFAPILTVVASLRPQPRAPSPEPRLLPFATAPPLAA